MATSGTTSFSQTRNQVIYDAFHLLTIYGVGETVSAEDMTFASNILNKMVKAWETKGLHLWTQTEAVLYLTQYEERYSLGSTAKAANIDNSFTTRLSADVAAAATTVTVDSTVGMSTGKPIGIVQNDKSLFWTTITSVDSSTQISLTSGLDVAASDQALVYYYSTAISKPLRIHEYARIVSGYDNGITSTEIEIPVSIVSYKDYMALPTKTLNSAYPIQAMFNPYVDYGNLWLFPRPNDTSYRLYFTYERKIEDMTNSDNTFDFPQEWLECLTYQLALRLARPFGRASALADIAPMASEMLDNLLAWDAEREYLEIVPCNYQ